MNAALTTEISRLTPAEKLKLVEELWDTLAANPDQLPVPAWHAKLLDEAQAAYDANPAAGSPWSEVQARLRQRS